MKARELQKKGFPPIIDENTRILILGSLPGNISIHKNEYYGNPRNQFWSIIGKHLNQNIIDFTYENRCKLLLNHNIGLWDIYAEAERKSSLDIDIKLPIYNNIEKLIETLPQLEKILLNGKLAEKAFNKQLPKINLAKNIQIFTLPSTSPANAQLKLEEKYICWQKALQNKMP